MTMLQFHPAAAWLQTYAWMVKSAIPIPSTDNSTEGMTVSIPKFSQAKWNHWDEPNWSLLQSLADNSPWNLHKHQGATWSKKDYQAQTDGPGKHRTLETMGPNVKVLWKSLTGYQQPSRTLVGWEVDPLWSGLCYTLLREKHRHKT